MDRAAPGGGVTQQQLGQLAWKWQERLGLVDWHIQIMFVGRERLGDYYGATIVNRKRRTAEIRILELGDWPASDARLDQETLERTVIHEILHCWFDPFEKDDDEENEIRIEQAVNAISKALLELD